MKISKIFLMVFLLGFLLFGFLYVWNGIQYGKKKAVWESEINFLNYQISELEMKIDAAEDVAHRWRDRAFEKAKEVLVLQTELEDVRRVHELDLARIAELAPNEIVVETRTILQVSDMDVFLNQMGVQFSLVASRVNLSKLQTLEFTLKIEVPKLNGIITTRTEENQALHMSLQSYEVEIVPGLKDEIKLWKKKYEGEHALRKAAEKSFNLFSTKNLVVGGAVAAVVGGLILVLK